MSSAPRQPEVLENYPAASSTAEVSHRTFDVVCAAAGLILLSPLFCLVAIAIKLDDGGPVFYLQDRIGRNFRTFRLCKFRSMIAGADRSSLITAPADVRLTRIGEFLRRYKIDELPQLFNILKGDMQLVGSRPEVERYVQMFRADYAVILRDRPGITDPASLAYRHEANMLAADRLEQQYIDEILPAKLKLSMDYQKRRTFLSDIGILLRTVAGVLD